MREMTHIGGKTHGHCGAVYGKTKHSPTYNTWHGMKNRCDNPRQQAYKYYGGRGIKVCDRWFLSFENFLEDMGERPKGTTLDRIDNDENYEPGNCRWITQKEQLKNRRKSSQTPHYAKGLKMPKVELKRTIILIEAPLLKQVDALLFDPVRNKLTYGARSQLVNELLRMWVLARQEEALAQAKAKEALQTQKEKAQKDKG